MTIEIKKRENKGYTFYETHLFGRVITLSKKLVDKLKAEGKLKKTTEVGADWLLTASTTTKGDKSYTNYYFTVAQPKQAKADSDGDDDLPF